MSNMCYCRFENTLADLQDCYDNLHQFDNGELSKSEANAAYQLVKLAKEIASGYGYVELDEICKQNNKDENKMKLSIEQTTVYRQYYTALESLKYQLEAEMSRYENGEPMSGGYIITAASEVMRYGARAEMVTHWIDED